MATKITDTEKTTTYEGQLAGRVAELLPGQDTDARLELLGAMDPDDMRTSLAFIAGMFPQAFDFGLVRDRKLVERLQDRLDHQHDDDPEPYCTTCGATVAIFIAHGDAWLHYTGQGTVESPVELFDAGHAPVIAWRETAPPDEEAADNVPAACIFHGGTAEPAACWECLSVIGSPVGRLVVRDYDGSPGLTVGRVVGQVDEDTLEVLWGERRFAEDPGTGSYEPFDSLRPAPKAADL
jgi:hypothetical protein